MQKSFAYLAAAALTITAAAPAFAQTSTHTTHQAATTTGVHTGTPLTQAQATTRLQTMGYANITGLKMDDGKWEGKGVKDGQIMEFEMNAANGTMVKEEIDR